MRKFLSRIFGRQPIDPEFADRLAAVMVPITTEKIATGLITVAEPIVDGNPNEAQSLANYSSLPTTGQ